jgi:hypothetical protein
VATLPGQQAWATGMAALLIETKWAVERAAAAGADQLDPRRLDHYRARYQAIIAEGWRANPAATRTSGGRGGRQRRSKAANLLVRLDDHREQVLRFATDLRVPFSNSQAERDVRMAKLQQKISGGWRTLAGAQRFCRLRSYVATARKQQVGVLPALRRVFEGDPGCGRRRSVTRQPGWGMLPIMSRRPRRPLAAGAATHHAPARRDNHRCRRHPSTSRAHPSGRAGR